ncbi:MAG TPA: hypothetical protein VFT91_11875, partial [Dehalococcoidia bacterium]|nr:hypothetical protein [Dehalococcoidia bacterium]
MTESAASRTKWLGIGAFLVGGCLVVALAGASVWQANVHNSKLDEAQSRAAAASYLQDAKKEGATVVTLLKRYVASGDETLIPEVKSHASSGVESLTLAVAQGGAVDLTVLAQQGSRLVEGAGQIIAVRQSGDAQGAAAAAENLKPAFDQVTAAVDGAVAAELAEAASQQHSAESAKTAAFWLAISAAVVG